MERNMEEVLMNTQMEMHMRAILLMGNEKEREYIHGVIRAIIKVIGREIKCTVKAFLCTQMEKLLKGFLKMIK